MIEMEINKKPKSESSENRKVKRHRQMPAVPVVPFFLSVSIMWALRCGRSRLVLHLLFTASHWLRGGGLITSQREAEVKGTECLSGPARGLNGRHAHVLSWVWGCRCLCVGADLLWELQRARCPDVWFTILCFPARGVSLYLNHWCWHTIIHVVPSDSTHCSILCAKKWAGTFLSQCSQYAVVVESMWLLRSWGSLTWRWRVVLLQCIKLLRTSWSWCSEILTKCTS